MKEFGGDWTERKLNALLAYARAYLQVFKHQQWAETIYFDGFAGSGNAKILPYSGNVMIDSIDNTTPADFRVYEGAARQMVMMDNASFDYYLLVDKDPSNYESLQNLQYEATHLPPGSIIVEQGDSNLALNTLIKMMKLDKGRRALLFLDPFGMQMDWKSIAQLKEVNYDKGGVDLWLLVPTGVAINRLIPKNPDKRHPGNEKKLEQFFGLSIDKIRDFLYQHPADKRMETGLISLFDLMEDEEIDEPLEKVSQPIEKIMDIYRAQLQTIWKHVTEKPLVLKNSRNTPIFHFVFASNNPTAMRIATDIIDKRQE